MKIPEFKRELCSGRCLSRIFSTGIAVFLSAIVFAEENGFHQVPLQSHITNVQPMTGIVMWEDSKNSNSDAIQLEYSYMRYSDVVKNKGVYDWTPVERKLNAGAHRKHQAILRFWDTYPGRPTSVPAYIKALPDYKETQDQSEGRDTGFPDWSHPEYQRFFLEFYEKFAEKYDRDPRLAFLETGFGLWAEYHIYSGPELPGKTFPSLEFQSQFFKHLTHIFQETPWLISEDAHEGKRTPFASKPELLKLTFGIFDDTFHLAWEPGYNLDGWNFFGRERCKRSPMGGEILFPNKQQDELVSNNWVKETRNFGITFMICEQWLRWTTMERIREYGLACGYKFKVTVYEAGPTEVARYGDEYRRSADLLRCVCGGKWCASQGFTQIPPDRRESAIHSRFRGCNPQTDNRMRPPSVGAANRLRCEFEIKRRNDLPWKSF